MSVESGMDFTQIIPQLLPLISSSPWFNVATAVIALASATAAVTKTPKTGAAAKFYSVIDFLALNFFHAKEK